MALKKNVEVLIIGAGPSGLAAAKTLSNQGIETVILEKSINEPNTKQFRSSPIFEKSIEPVFGKYWESKDFPIERYLAELRAYILGKDSFTSMNLRKDLNNCFISKREKLIYWMRKEVEKSGVSISYETTAHELIIQNGRISGAKTETTDFYANVVILAEGVNCLLTKKSGLRKGELTPELTFLFVEEELKMPSGLIEERFNLTTGQGITAKLFTTPLFNIPSISYLNINKSSVSLGTGILLSESVSSGININYYQELLKKSPAISPLIKDSTTINYYSYILPFHKRGHSYHSSVKLYENNCLITGGAALLVEPFSWDSSEKAMLSGKLAGKTVIRAKNLNDYSKQTLSYYNDLIQKNISITTPEIIALAKSEENQSLTDQKSIEDLSYFIIGEK